MRSLLVLLLLTSSSLARDLDGQYAQAPLRDWFSQQRNVRGDVCCNDADGHPADDWGRQGRGYWAEWGGMHWDVPADALVSGVNRFGAAIVWVYPKGSETLRCFMPGTEG